MYFWREDSVAALGPDRTGGGRKGVAFPYHPHSRISFSSYTRLGWRQPHRRNDHIRGAKREIYLDVEPLKQGEGN